jgi:hypothetical protein
MKGRERLNEASYKGREEESLCTGGNWDERERRSDRSERREAGRVRVVCES